MTHHNRQIDFFADEIAVFALCRVVTGFEHDVDDVAQRRQQIEEDVEQVLGGNRCGQDGNFQTGLLILVGVAALALARHDEQVGGRADGIGQSEVPVAVNEQMSSKIVGGHGSPCAGATGKAESSAGCILVRSMDRSC